MASFLWYLLGGFFEEEHMSYLSFPRLAFAGKFQADPSTINNDPGHFDTSRFRANYQLEGNPITWELPGGMTTPGMTNGWWNPRGSGAWRFYECKVSSVVYSDGSTCQDPSQDLTVGASINSTDRRVEGKLVDLDPEQQMVSEIWGFQVGLDVTNAAYNAAFGFLGSYEASPFIDIF